MKKSLFSSHSVDGEAGTAGCGMEMKEEVSWVLVSAFR